MQMPKKIKEIPFKEYSGIDNDRVRYQIDAYAKNINHERLYIIDLIVNLRYWYLDVSWYKKESNSSNVRIVVSKNKQEYTVYSSDKQKCSMKKIDKILNTYNYCDIDDKSKKIIKTLCNDSSVEAICDLLNEYYSKKQTSLREKNGYIFDDTVFDCPTELPEGLLDYIGREILPKDNTLIYKKGNSRGVCALCGERVTSHRAFKQYQFTKCPNCYNDVACILENSAAWKADYVCNIVGMQRGKDNAVWFRQWHLNRNNYAVYNNIENYLTEIARYVIIGDKSAAWRNVVKEQAYIGHRYEYSLGSWQRYKSTDVYDNGYEFYASSIPEIVKGTKLQYAQLDEYIKLKKSNPVKYCRYFVKYPVFEFLFKKGFYQVIVDKLFGYGEQKSGIYWERKKLKDCFKFPLRLLKFLPPDKWDSEKINRCWILSKAEFPDDEIKFILSTKLPIDSIVKMRKFVSFTKAKKYIEGNYKNYYDDIYNAYIDYADYLTQCLNLDYDMKSKSVLFPKNLFTAHQKTTVLIENKKYEKYEHAFLKVYEKLKKKSFENDELIIRPAHSPSELVAEGSALGHCVGTAGYIEDMAESKTFIFFIRQKANPDKPYFTLEYKNHRLVQCRTKNNRSFETEESVKNFIEEWFKNKKMKKGA